MKHSWIISNLIFLCLKIHLYFRIKALILKVAWVDHTIFYFEKEKFAMNLDIKTRSSRVKMLICRTSTFENGPFSKQPFGKGSRLTVIDAALYTVYTNLSRHPPFCSLYSALPNNFEFKEDPATQWINILSINRNLLNADFELWNRFGVN